MTDTKIKAQGAKGDDAIAPQVQINATTNEWEISTDITYTFLRDLAILKGKGQCGQYDSQAHETAPYLGQ